MLFVDVCFVKEPTMPPMSEPRPEEEEVEVFVDVELLEFVAPLTAEPITLPNKLLVLELELLEAVVPPSPPHAVSRSVLPKRVAKRRFVCFILMYV